MSKVDDDAAAVQIFFPAFQLSYQNKSCSECQQDDRKTCRQTERQIEDKSLVIKTKVVQNVNRMLVCPYGREAGQLKSLLLFTLFLRST